MMFVVVVILYIANMTLVGAILIAFEKHHGLT